MESPAKKIMADKNVFIDLKKAPNIIQKEIKFNFVKKQTGESKDFTPRGELLMIKNKAAEN